MTWLVLLLAVVVIVRGAQVMPSELNAEKLESQAACAEEALALGDDDCATVHWEEEGGTSCVTVIDFECMVRRSGTKQCAERIARLNDPCVTLLEYDINDNACHIRTDMYCRNGGSVVYSTGLELAAKFWAAVTRLLSGEPIAPLLK
jgi:hypothetical protein